MDRWLESCEESPLWADWDEAWRNGVAFLHARDGLRGRPPVSIDWRGGTRPSPDAVIPADLRFDLVYLVSCKYLSKVLFNGAPTGVFEGAMGLIPTPASGDWFSEIAPLEHQALYAIVRRDLTAGQPTVSWSATVRDREKGQIVDVRGHVEVRWSHGRFGGPPEAKVYLDTAPADMPGYYTLR